MRDATDQVVTDEQFQHFLHTHRHISCLVPESNQAMRNSYLILDEYMRFLMFLMFLVKDKPFNLSQIDVIFIISHFPSQFNEMFS